MSDSGLIPCPVSWDETLMEMAFTISKRSRDPRTKVGCVIASPDHLSIVTGWNGFPSGFPDSAELWNARDRSKNPLVKYDVVIHAEMNAILNSPVRPVGWSMYCTHKPCVRCATHIRQAGIAVVYYRIVPDTKDLGCDLSDLIHPRLIRI